jgi:hypothetical protein
MTRHLAVLFLLAPAACAPIVTHGPRVEPGLHATGTFGVARSACDTACDIEVLPQIGIGARYGRAAEGGRVGYSIGGTIALRIESSDLDAYLQLPTAPNWAAGGGVLLSPMHLMPYVQAGAVDADGSGFYTTQGFTVMAPRPKDWWIEEEVDVAPRYWAPTLAYRAAHRDGALHVYVSGMLGWMDVPAGEGSRREPVRVLMAGLSFERHIRRSVTPIPPPQPPPPTP